MSDKTETKVIISAMRTLANDIETDDGVANAAIRQAADRLEAQAKEIVKYKSLLETFVNNTYDTEDEASIEAAKLMGYSSVEDVVDEVQNRMYQKRKVK